MNLENDEIEPVDPQRTRLKLTIFLVIALIMLMYVPIDIIYKAAEYEKFDLINPWASFIAIISTIGLVSGYYINKETQRSSLIDQTYNFNRTSDVKKKVLAGEDETDPGMMPI